MSRRGIKRVLKPVIEKKRRDRINQRLDELRTILLCNTSDMRLKNPKLEKAEILELTVDYMRGKANGNDNKDSSAPVITTASPINSASTQKQTQTPHNPIYSAGFQECVTRLENFIESVDPSQRESFVQGLKNQLDAHSTCQPGRTAGQSVPVDGQPWGPEGPYCFGRLQNRKEGSLMGHYRGGREPFPFINTPVSMYPKSFVLHHPHPAQSLTHPYLSPPYSLSPPPSPCYSSSSPPFTTSPPYLSLPCHFPFPPSPSQLSADASSSSPPSTSPPVMAGHPPLVASPPTPLRPSAPVPDGPTSTLRRSLFQIQPQAVWRPWP